MPPRSIIRSILRTLPLALAFVLPALADTGPGSSTHPHPNGGGWIGEAGHRNAAGELCCGERDCFELASEDVTVVPHGYFIKSRNEFVPQQEAQPSPDGQYWRCQWGGKRKCFFAPPGAV